MKVAIIGAGPSGLMAAWATVNLGHSVTLFDKNPEVATKNHGVFYLHEDCGLNVREQQTFTSHLPRHWSEARARVTYAEKVYGNPEQPVSFHRGLERVYHAGDAVTQLKTLFRENICEREFTELGKVLDLGAFYDRVIVTIPARVLLKGDFQSRPILVRHRPVPMSNFGYVWYNAGEQDWTRVSQVFETQATEKLVPPEVSLWRFFKSQGYVQVHKVITADRKLWEGVPEQVLWTGRYGAWDKSMLTHTVYTDILGRLR